MRRVWTAAALVAAGLAAEPVAADVLCSGHKGRVVIRSSCKKHESALDPSKGPTGDPGAPAGPTVRIVDATGKPVGLFAELCNEDNPTSVLFDAGGQVVTFHIRPQGFEENGQLYHLVPHCADAPLVLVSPTPPLVREGWVLGTTAYYAGDPIEPKTPASREIARESTGCGANEPLANGNCCEVTSALGANVYGPMVTAFEIPSLGLTLPLRAEP
jgi:hypothetical protein